MDCRPIEHGLLTASYIPDKDQRELRELVRYRKSLVGERNRELNRLQKMLEGANIKISGTIRDINGKRTRNLLEHILSGRQIDSAEYDLLYEQNIIAHNRKATKEPIIDDLNGVNMERFPTDVHISSWAGLCPRSNESAHKRKSGKTAKGNVLLRDSWWCVPIQP